MDGIEKSRAPSEAEVDVAEAWLDEHYGSQSVPMRITIDGTSPEGFAFALAAAMTRRRDRAGISTASVQAVH